LSDFSRLVIFLLIVFGTDPLFIPIDLPGVLGHPLTVEYHFPYDVATTGQGVEFVKEPLHIFMCSMEFGLDSGELPKRLLRLSLGLREHLLDHLVVGDGDGISLADNGFLASLGHVGGELQIEEVIVDDDARGSRASCRGFLVLFESGLEVAEIIGDFET
jgi:hypothetical protein